MKPFSRARLPRWLRLWLSPEFFRFWCVGWLNLAVAWGLEAGLTCFLPANGAFSLGYALSLLFSFFSNARLTFRVQASPRRLLRYCVGYIPNFLVQSGIVLLLHNYWGLPPRPTYLIAIAVGTPVTFLCLKWYSFR